jgi:hypothetical protein
MWDDAGRTIVEVMGNAIWVFDVATGVKTTGNPGPSFSVYNGAWTYARTIYLWASNSAKDTCYLLTYNVDTLASKITQQDKIAGIDVSGGPSSTVCTAYDYTTNIAYVAANKGSKVFAVDIKGAKVIGEFDLQTVDSGLFAPLSAPCSIDIANKTVYFGATHYNPNGNEYRVLSLDITNPSQLRAKTYIISSGVTFQLDTTARMISGTDGNSTLFQIDGNSNNGTSFVVPGYTGTGKGFVVVDPRDSSTFLIDTNTVIGPVTLTPKGTISAGYTTQTLPFAVSGPAIFDAKGCAIYVRSSEGKTVVTYSIPLVSDAAGSCAPITSDASHVYNRLVVLVVACIIVLIM